MFYAYTLAQAQRDKYLPLSFLRSHLEFQEEPATPCMTDPTSPPPPIPPDKEMATSATNGLTISHLKSLTMKDPSEIMMGYGEW